MVTTQFFGAKLQRYMHDHGIPPTHPRRGRREGLRERRVDAARVAPDAALLRRYSSARAMLANPLTQYMLCSPGEGAVALVALPTRVPRAPPRSASRLVPLGRVPYAPRRARSRSSARRFRSSSLRPRVEAAREAFESAARRAGRGRRRPGPGHRVGRRAHPPRGVRFLRAGRAGRALRDGCDADRGRLPVNTDGGCLGTASPSAPPG